ncbi:MAG: chromosome partitioning protein [Treponema sp.]|nr:chromosome partitioning protein [Treponema sp.]
MEENTIHQNQGIASFNETNLAGMNTAEAKEYILGFITTLKLTEKEIRSLEEEADKWENRKNLAASKNTDDLYKEAEAETEKINTKLAGLREEERSLKEGIAVMQRQLPGLNARERTIDPDLLDQELMMAAGLSEEEVKTDRAFVKLEKETSAEAALEALKAKMNSDSGKEGSF